jgi:hypothetical protein
MFLQSPSKQDACPAQLLRRHLHHRHHRTWCSAPTGSGSASTGRSVRTLLPSLYSARARAAHTLPHAPKHSTRPHRNTGVAFVSHHPLPSTPGVDPTLWECNNDGTCSPSASERGPFFSEQALASIHSRHFHCDTRPLCSMAAPRSALYRANPARRGCVALFAPCTRVEFSSVAAGVSSRVRERQVGLPLHQTATRHVAHHTCVQPQ